MRIFIGIPTIRYYPAFWNSMKRLVLEINKSHEVHIVQVKNKSIAEARNMIVDRFLKSDCDYLLFLDDDHSGHTMEMFNALLNAREYVCAIKCYTREFPHYSNLLEYSKVDHKELGIEEGRGRYRPLDNEFGYVDCDLVGFGMTLISRETFSKIQEPYFVSDHNQREDNYFCDKLINCGIRPVGCFDYVLDHQGIGKNNATQLRDKGIQELLQHNPNMTTLVA